MAYKVKILSKHNGEDRNGVKKKGPTYVFAKRKFRNDSIILCFMDAPGRPFRDAKLTKVHVYARAREKDVTFTKEFNAKCFAHKLPKNVIKKVSLSRCYSYKHYE